MFRLSAHQSGDTFDIWLFDDHAEEHGGDHNLMSAWEDLLEGATTVTVQACRPTRSPIVIDPETGEESGGDIISQTNWVTFTVNLARFYAKKNLRANLAQVTRDVEWLVRFSIDGGAWTEPVSFRWVP